MNKQNTGELIAPLCLDKVKSVCLVLLNSSIILKARLTVVLSAKQQPTIITLAKATTTFVVYCLVKVTRFLLKEDK